MKKYDKEPNPVKSQAFINTTKKKRSKPPIYSCRRDRKRKGFSFEALAAPFPTT
jgi:hypothetical protein